MATQNLEMTQKQAIRLSAQQIRFVRLLELNAPELDEAVEREMEDNPALANAEEDHPVESMHEFRPYYPRHAEDGESPSFSPPDTEESLYDSLYEQLATRDLSPEVAKVARFIIGSLDSNGYLSRSLTEIVDDMAFGPGIIVDMETAAAALAAVRSLDPPGMGARDLQDALAMQLEAMPESSIRDNAHEIIRNAFEAFTMKHKHRIMSQLKMSEPDVDEALALILSLNPKPGSAVGTEISDSANQIVPDFIISNEDGNLSVTLNTRIPELRIERSFEQAMADIEKLPRAKRKKGSEFIVSRYNDARDFIRILSQRQQTMLAVMEAIMKIQEEYFRTEDVYTLRPMMLKNIADLTGFDFSVISRATNNKYVATPWGIFPLRFFFSDSIGEEKEGGDTATNRKIEASIMALIEKEDKKHPLSDRKIAEELNRSGMELSRRTVAKYRDRQGIPVARLRKNL